MTTLAKAKVRANDTFIVQALFMIVTYDRHLQIFLLCRPQMFNGTACMRHKCRKVAIISDQICLIFRTVEKVNNI